MPSPLSKDLLTRALRLHEQRHSMRASHLARHPGRAARPLGGPGRPGARPRAGQSQTKSDDRRFRVRLRLRGFAARVGGLRSRNRGELRTEPTDGTDRPN